jgi:hypothetical protein
MGPRVAWAVAGPPSCLPGSVARGFGPHQLAWHGSRGRWAHGARCQAWWVDGGRLSTILGLVLVFGCGLARLPHGLEHTFGRAAGQPDSQRVSRPSDRPVGGTTRRAGGLAALTSVIDQLANRDLTGLSDATLAERVLQLRRQLDRLEGHWLAELATVDARGAAGTDQHIQAASTASWLRNRLRLGAGAASNCVRAARAVFRGPLARTGTALTGGPISPAHASVLAHGTQDLSTQVAAEAEPVLLEAARPAGSTPAAPRGCPPAAGG